VLAHYDPALKLMTPLVAGASESSTTDGSIRNLSLVAHLSGFIIICPLASLYK
jgi:hypothetical protein